MRCKFYLLEFYGNEAYNLLTNWLAFKTFSYSTNFFFIRNIDVLMCVYGSRCAPSVKGCQSEEKGQKRKGRREVFRAFNW